MVQNVQAVQIVLRRRTIGVFAVNLNLFKRLERLELLERFERDERSEEMNA